MVARPGSSVSAGGETVYDIIVDNLGPDSANAPSVVAELLATVPFEIL